MIERGNYERINSRQSDAWQARESFLVFLFSHLLVTMRGQPKWGHNERWKEREGRPRGVQPAGRSGSLFTDRRFIHDVVLRPRASMCMCVCLSVSFPHSGQLKPRERGGQSHKTFRHKRVAGPLNHSPATEALHLRCFHHFPPRCGLALLSVVDTYSKPPPLRHEEELFVEEKQDEME